MSFFLMTKSFSSEVLKNSFYWLRVRALVWILPIWAPSAWAAGGQLEKTLLQMQHFKYGSSSRTLEQINNIRTCDWNLRMSLLRRNYNSAGLDWLDRLCNGVIENLQVKTKNVAIFHTSRVTDSEGKLCDSQDKLSCPRILSQTRDQDVTNWMN